MVPDVLFRGAADLHLRECGPECDDRPRILVVGFRRSQGFPADGEGGSHLPRRVLQPAEQGEFRLSEREHRIGRGGHDHQHRGERAADPACTARALVGRHSMRRTSASVVMASWEGTYSLATNLPYPNSRIVLNTF